MKKRTFQKWRKRSIPFLIMGVFLCGINHFPTEIAVASSLSEAQKEKKELEQELKKAQKIIDELKTSQGDVQENIKNLNSRLVEISAQITSLEENLTDKSNEIIQTKDELDVAQQKADCQYEDMKVRIQYMYENSRASYMQLLLMTKSFPDFLNAVEYIAAIESYDRNKLAEYEETVVYISNTEQILEQEYAELEEMKAEVQQQKQAVAALMEQKEIQLANIQDELSDAVSEAEYYEAEIQAQEEMIAQIQAAEAAKKAEEEKKKAQQQEGEESSSETTSPEYSGGAFRWPCPSSSRVTSDFGTRNAPTAGASTNHKGIDIGASYGADIVAAAAGKVIGTGYSSSGGNYVMIDHGAGLYTVYMHASSVSVSSGQAVQAGDVVAKVGSTGISTGNHLHFGVSLNGSYVSPWNYLARP